MEGHDSSDFGSGSSKQHFCDFCFSKSVCQLRRRSRLKFFFLPALACGHFVQRERKGLNKFERESPRNIPYTKSAYSFRRSRLKAFCLILIAVMFSRAERFSNVRLVSAILGAVAKEHSCEINLKSALPFRRRSPSAILFSRAKPFEQL